MHPHAISAGTSGALPFLASTLDVTQIGTIWQAIAYLVGMAVAMGTLWRIFRRQPPDHERYASRQEMRELAATVADNERKSRESVSRVYARIEEGIAGIRKESGDQRDRLGRIEATNEAQAQAINQIALKQDRQTELLHQIVGRTAATAPR